MEYQEAFEIWRPILANISPEQIKAPRIPVDKFCAEAEELYVVCQIDKTELLSTGINWQDVENLNSLSSALRYCQAIWVSTPTRSAEMQQWLQTKKEALSLKKELFRHFDYAFHNDVKTKSRLSDIRQRKDNRSLPFVLSTLAQIGEKNATQLQKISFDTGLIQQARELSLKASEHMALLNASNNKEANKLWRDRAYTLLHEKINRIRKCGQYCFHEDKEKCNKYHSNYYRKYNNSNRNMKFS
ncbi:MAG: hypothetical protein MI866_06705 [Bacteroidales bacterium]|nr:hypothetical protein [Bacteroidales bacterium]